MLTSDLKLVQLILVETTLFYSILKTKQKIN